MKPIAVVSTARRRPEDDYWGGEQSCITLAPEFPPHALAGLDAFSHVEVVFVLHVVEPSKIVTGVRRPQNSFRSPRRFANRLIQSDKSREIASTWLKLTPENGARAFSHSVGLTETDGLSVSHRPNAGRWQVMPMPSATQRQVRTLRRGLDVCGG
jgi:hypothetical protein